MALKLVLMLPGLPAVLLVTVIWMTIVRALPPPPAVLSPKFMKMAWLLYWRIVLLSIRQVWSPPPSASTSIPLASDDPELAVAATPIVLLVMRPFITPSAPPAVPLDRAKMALPFEPFRVLF